MGLNSPQQSTNASPVSITSYILQLALSNPQSGGLHERTVQTVKNILKKCRETDQDPYLALLDYQNTPIDGVTPAQALVSRRLRSSLPISQQRLRPATIDRTTFLTIRGEQQQKKYFNNTSKPLPPLKKGDRVRFRKDPESPWQPVVVKAQHDTPQNYIIETSNGSQYCRNKSPPTKDSRETTRQLLCR